MQKKRTHSKQHPEPKQEVLDMISGSYIPWEKSKEQVWSELEKRLEESQTAKTRFIYTTWMKLAVAAIIIILLGVPVIMQLYTKTIRVPSGKHSSILLPDNSQVRLNAQSTLSYKPLLWKFSRHITFEGEAYFKVQPGRKFEVTSGHGTTLVLGTSFNIYSRNVDYQVTCISGEIKVIENISKKEVFLYTGQKAELNPEGMLEVQSDINTEQALSWLHNRFNFTSVQLTKVFEEICRQYGVTISIPGDIDNTYTGTFNRSASVENVLNLVCKPFELKFIRKSEDEYIIFKNN